MGNFRGGFGGGFGGNFGQLMKQAQKMQQDIENTRRELAETEFTSSVSGGLVEVIMTGDRNLKSISINPEIVDPDDVEMIEDMVCAAVNDVLSKINETEKERLPQMPV